MVSMTPALIRGKARMNNLHEVKNLNLWGQDLDDVSILQQLTGVEVLSLSVNHISSLAAFGACASLRELYLRKNEVDKLEDVRYLMRLPQLKVLWLSDNPCAAHPSYRMTVIRNLPGLDKLDNQEISGQERQQAARAGTAYTPATDADMAAALAAAAEAKQQGAVKQASATSRRESGNDAMHPSTPQAPQQGQQQQGEMASSAAPSLSSWAQPQQPLAAAHLQRQTSQGPLPHLSALGTQVAQLTVEPLQARPAAGGVIHAATPGGSSRPVTRPSSSGSAGAGAVGGSKNVLYAVMALLAELPEGDLMLVARDVEARLAGLRGCS